MKLQFKKDKRIFYSVIAISTILSSCDNHIDSNKMLKDKMKFDIILKEFKKYPKDIQEKIEHIEKKKDDLRNEITEDYRVLRGKLMATNKEHRDEDKIMNDDQFNSRIESIKKCDEQIEELKNSVKD
ncbi:hypothetical protein CKC_03640 [Candidatus Liberibacter solanacearum CLso-ZC1]|uniref:Lipoprotein n=1 Tax=Liberibacter solanacearum (strain CLso-ZC1) TaxID=658172 RepID=E4UBH1_LIBSC|nr:hypothetical protein [Candidatus Liberibacter solanacearum]ADR52477.1 hypothetical protein CKC_03640 [Candidatus Liberibacter solanacearum CLso-ZC1]